MRGMRRVITTVAGYLSDIGNGVLQLLGSKSLQVDGQVLLADGTAATPAMSFTSDPDTGIINASGDQLAIIAGGIELLRLIEGAADYLQIPNDIWLKATDNAGTGTISMFKTNTSDEIEAGATVIIGTVTFATDAGAVTAMNLPVQSDADDTEESYAFNVDSNNVLKIYGQSDGIGGADTFQVLATAGILANPGLGILGDPDTGIYGPAADQLGLVAGGSEIVNLTQNDAATDQMTVSAHIEKKVTAGITASATQSQGQQPLVSDVNEISTCAIANDTVTLPSAVAGMQITVINNGAQTLQVFPASGDDLGAGVDNSTTITAGAFKVFVAYDATNWQDIT